MHYHCHISLTCKYLYITYMYRFDTGLYFFPAYRTLILCCCFSPFGCLEDKHEIDDDIFFRPFACLRWLLVLEGGIVWRFAPLTSSSCHAEHLFVSLLPTAQHLTHVVVCDSSFYYGYSCIIIVCV